MEAKPRICAMCGEAIAGEPFIFEGSPVCADHREEIESSGWTMVGHYRRRETGEHRRDAVLERIPCSLLVETAEPRGFALYVRVGDRAQARRALAELHDYLVSCGECEMEYGRELPFCPVCGERAGDRPARPAKRYGHPSESRD